MGAALLVAVLACQSALAGASSMRLAVSAAAVGQDDDEGDFAGGASLKTDPELQQLLKKADEFASDGRHDLACVLWQRVLDESAGTVMTREEWLVKYRRSYRRYRSVTAEIEQTIAKLPPHGLRIYRLTADGEAQAILASGEGERLEEALAQVTQRYFLSSHGDDAAFKLACLRMDRYDFVGASRLLTKVLEEYPDPTVSREEILLRLAVASARVGDRETAHRTLADLREDRRLVSTRLVSLVEEDMAREGVETPRLADASDQWPMPYGNPARTGHMKSLPASITSGTMSELWNEGFDLSLASSAGGSFPYPVHAELHLARKSIRAPRTQTSSQTRDQLIERWNQSGWAPAGQVLFYRDMVYYKSNERVVCRDAHTGKLVWMGRPNRFQMDQLSNIYAQQGAQLGRPRSAPEVMLFGDRIHQGMTISEGILYNVEGPLVDGDGVTATTQPRSRHRHRYGYSIRRTRRNWLAAYQLQTERSPDLPTGRFLWRRSAAGEEHGGKFDVGFLAAPVPFARFLLVPVSDNGSLWMYALDKKAGETVWKTFLCDDPISGASPWSPVAVAVDGGDAYVSTGAGVVFALDALSGTTRWAVRYERTGAAGGGNINYRNRYQLLNQLRGWEQDMVIPHGKHLVVMASDSDELFALDRRTGEFLWDSPRTPYSEVPPSEYCLGVVGDGLYVGGKNIVRRYDIPSGRLIWEARLDSSLGRGALTADAIYVPENESIVRLNLKGGKREARVSVFSASQEPVGNLFTDGKRLMALGLGRIYALTDLSYRMELLAGRIKAGDVQAQLERMRLRLRENNHVEALDDLRGAYETLLKRRQTEDAIATLCGGVRELALASRDPDAVLRLVAEMPSQVRTSNGPAPLPDALAMERGDVLKSALTAIVAQETKGAAAEVLSVVPLCNGDHLIRAARNAMEITATPDDGRRLKEALADPSPEVRTVALAGLNGALGDEALDVLAGALDDESDHIKIEAARALGNAGDRRALIAFGELLESDDVEIRADSVQALRALTGQKFKFSAYDKADARAEATRAWQEWIAGEGQSAKLEFPIRRNAFMVGRTLICYYSQNKVVELDANGEEIWKHDVPYAWGCHGLPNGHRVIASYSGRFVAEFDSDGREIWKKTGLPGAPFSVERLENGNTLVTCSDSQKVIEISPDKRVVWDVKISGRPMDARRLENGNTLIALQTVGKVVEVDRSGEVVWEVTGQSGALSASRLENGNTLICRSGNNMVVEVNRRGDVVWAQRDLRNPYDAQRLPDGNTLIADYTGVREVDAKGEVVWRREGKGASRVHRY